MDLCFSGFARSEFITTASILLQTSRQWPVIELKAWDLSNLCNRTVLDTGTNIGEALDVLEFDFEAIKRLSIRISLDTGGSLTIDAVRLDHILPITGIEGQLFLRQEDAEDICPDLRRNIESTMVKCSEELGAVVTVSDEDDFTLILLNEPLLMIPTLAASSPWPLAPRLRTELEKRDGIEIVSTPQAFLIRILGGLEGLEARTRSVLEEWLFAEARRVGLG